MNIQRVIVLFARPIPPYAVTIRPISQISTETKDVEMRRTLLTIFAATAALLSAAGCSGSKPATEVQTSTVTVQPSTASTTTETPAAGGNYYGGPEYLIQALNRGGFECSDVRTASTFNEDETAAMCKTAAQYGGAYISASTYGSQAEVEAAMRPKSLGKLFAKPSMNSAYVYGPNWIVTCLPGGPQGPQPTCEAVQQVIRGTLAN